MTILRLERVVAGSSVIAEQIEFAAEIRTRRNIDVLSHQLAGSRHRGYGRIVRALIQERAKAGLAQAKREGRCGGRQKRVWRPKTELRVRQLRSEGRSWQDISREMRIPVGTLHAKFR